MGFALDSGYVPTTIAEVISAFRIGINTQFSTSYTDESFVGTNHYKWFYPIAQRISNGEIKTSEIFAYLQQYIEITNQRIQRPVVTPPGLIENFESSEWIASVKPMIEADAGKIHVCVDVDDEDADYDAGEDWKLQINTIIKNSVAGGIVSIGTETNTIVLSNGQAFDFKFNLPARVEPLFRLTTTLSDNNQVVIGTPESVKQTLVDNIAAKYRLGRDFEPQRYFTTADALWTSQVLLEYSLDGGSIWLDDIFQADYDDLFDVLLENIVLVEE
jgi:hypothetical protein